MFCTNCGTKISDSAKFCRGCGQPLNLGAPAEAKGHSKAITEGKDSQAYENDQAYGNGQAYGNSQVYDNGQAYGNSQTYSNSQSYASGQGWMQQGYAYSEQQGDGQNPYQPYGVQGANPYADARVKVKKKGKKGIVVAVVIILLAVIIGGLGFTYVKSADPMAPVNSMVKGMKNGNWGTVYDSIYWGEDPDYTKKEFIDESDSMGGLASMGISLSNLKMSKVSEGNSYVGEDGLIRKDLTVKMSITFMGMNQEEESEITVVKAGKKFLLIPEWKVDNESSGFGW